MPFWVIIITRNKVLITHTQDFDLKKKFHTFVIVKYIFKTLVSDGKRIPKATFCAQWQI